MAVKEIHKPAETQEQNSPEKKHKKLRGYPLFVTVFIAVIVIINTAAVLSKSFSDFFMNHIFRAAAATTGRFSGMFPFSLGEVLITLGIVLIAAAVVISILLIFLKRKQKYRRFVGRYMKSLLVIVLTVVLLYTFNCSIPYCSTMLNFAGGIREFDIDEFEAVRNYVVNECNELAPKMKRSEDGTMIFDGDPDKYAISALQGISGEFPRFKGYYPPAKSMWGSYYMYKSKIIGIYFPFSMEANYSKYVSDSYMPHVLAHEYAHLKGYIYESEANFMSFLACINSEDDAVRYSGYLCVLSYIEDDYTNAVTDDRQNKQPQISDLVKFDNTCYDRATWEYLKKRDEEKQQPKVAQVAENVGDKLTDAYMDAYSYEPNYSEVTLLMMQYYTEYGSFSVK